MDVEPYQLLPSHSIVPRFAVRDERRKRRTRQHAAAWADSNELQVVAPAVHQKKKKILFKYYFIIKVAFVQIARWLSVCSEFRLSDPHGMCLGTDWFLGAQQVPAAQTDLCQKMLLFSAPLPKFFWPGMCGWASAGVPLIGTCHVLTQYISQVLKGPAFLASLRVASPPSTQQFSAAYFCLYRLENRS